MAAGAVAQPKILLDGVAMTFVGKEGPVQALAGIELSVGDKEMVAIVGPSGCGKSTLLNLVAGFLFPTAGRVLIDGDEVDGPGAQRAVVFQQDSVFPWLTVADNIAYGPSARGVPRAAWEPRVNDLLDLVGLAKERTFLPRQLSGGMRKRVDLARAYANEPEILLMDESFGALDVLTKEKMQSSLLELWQRKPATVLFITHDIEEALFVGQRVVVMTARPARIAAEIAVPFPKSADPSIKTTPAFQDLRREIIGVLADTENATVGA
ncbi:MAG: ABC transporter ATP-binding protein [Chloroflexota bacterium]|nr:ABC transporter ATP-binding protein [Chloroflexota bacterium]